MSKTPHLRSSNTDLSQPSSEIDSADPVPSQLAVRAPASVPAPLASEDQFASVGGSTRRDVNSAIFRQALAAVSEASIAWRNPDDPGGQEHLVAVVHNSMAAFKPTDMIEGMIAAQATAMHHMSMECARRAMIPTQPAEIAHGHRKAATNASRAFVDLLEALDRKRGKGGQQRVVVEHVHVHPGGQAIVGPVGVRDGPGGAGGTAKIAAKPRTAPPRLAHDPAVGPIVPALRSADTARPKVPRGSDAEWPVPDARRR